MRRRETFWQECPLHLNGSEKEYLSEALFEVDTLLLLLSCLIVEPTSFQPNHMLLPMRWHLEGPRVWQADRFARKSSPDSGPSKPEAGCLPALERPSPAGPRCRAGWCRLLATTFPPEERCQSPMIPRWP